MHAPKEKLPCQNFQAGADIVSSLVTPFTLSCGCDSSTPRPHASSTLVFLALSLLLSGPSSSQGLAKTLEFLLWGRHLCRAPRMSSRAAFLCSVVSQGRV